MMSNQYQFSMQTIGHYNEIEESNMSSFDLMIDHLIKESTITNNEIEKLKNLRNELSKVSYKYYGLIYEKTDNKILNIIKQYDRKQKEIQDNNVVDDFISESLIKDDQSEITNIQIYKTFKHWCYIRYKNIMTRLELMIKLDNKLGNYSNNKLVGYRLNII